MTTTARKDSQINRFQTMLNEALSKQTTALKTHDHHAASYYGGWIQALERVLLVAREEA